MENAAKALVIAGGVLIAIMTLSLFLYGMTSATRIEQAQNEKKASEELAAFNMEYEAYNKQKLYGIDVITVINKAIENYNKMQLTPTTATTDKYYINVTFKTIDKCENELFRIDNTKENDDPNREIQTNSTDSILNSEITNLPEGKEKQQWQALKKVAEENTPLTAGTYSLGSNLGKKFVINNNFVNSFTFGSMNDMKLTTKNGGYTFILYSKLKNFKGFIFECRDLTDPNKSGVHYNPDTGRIDSITFVQVDRTNYSDV